MNKKIFILNILLLFLFISGYIYFTNFFIVSQFNNLKEKLLLEFKKATGFSLSYVQISPDIVNSIKVKNVRIYKDNDSFLDIGDIVIHYSIINFFRNRYNPFAIIKRITLNNLIFSYSKENLFNDIKDLLDKFKNNKLESNKENIISKIKNLEIKIVKSKIKIIDNNKTYSIEFKDIKASFKNRVKIDSIVYIVVKENNQIIIQNLTKINGSFYFLEKKLKSFFFIDFIKNEINGIIIKKQKFSFDSDGNNFFIKRLEDTLDLDLVISKEFDKIFMDIKVNLSYQDIKNIIISSQKKIALNYIYLNTKVNYNLNEKIVNGNIYLNSYLKDFYIFKNPEFIFNGIIKDSILRINEMALYTNNRENFISLENNSILSLNFDKVKTSIKIKDMGFLNLKLNSDIEILKEKGNIKIGWEYFLLNGENIGGMELFIKDYKKYLDIKTINKFNGYELNGIILKNNDKITANLHHNFENFLLNKFLKVLNIPVKSPIYLNTNFNTEIVNGKLFIPKSTFVIQDNINSLLTFDIGYSNNTLFIQNINQENYKIKGDIFVNFSQIPYYSSIIIKKEDFDFVINCFVFKNSITFDINKNFKGYLNYNNKILYLIATDFLIPLKRDKETLLSCNILFDIGNFNIKKSNLYIKNLNLFREKSGNLSLILSYNDNILLLDDIKYIDDENFITGKIEQNLFIKDKILNIKGIGLLKDDKNSESYSISYNIENSKIDGRLFLTHIDLNKFLKLNGFMDVRVGIKGELKNPDIELNGIITEGKIGRDSIKADFNIKKVDNKILFNKMIFEFGKNSLYINDSYLNLSNNSNLLINGTFYLTGLSKILKSDFKIESTFALSSNKLNFINCDTTFNNITLGILENNMLVKIEKSEGFTLNLIYKDNKYIVRNYDDKFLYAEFNEISRDLIIKFYENEQIFFDLSITLDQNNMIGNVKFIKFPVNLVQKVLIPYVNINKGLLDGEVNVSGTYKNPKINGTLNLYNGGVILKKYMVEPIENITGVLFIENNKIFVNNVNGIVNKSMVYGFGEIIFNGLKFERYNFKLNSEKLPVVLKENVINGKGEGYLEEFIIQSDSYSFDFIGKIFLSKAEIAISNMMGGDTNKNRVAKTYPINVILDIKAGKSVKVEYPIIVGTIKEGDLLTFKYIGNEPNIYLGGKINLRKGEINYFNKNFQIETAIFHFYENESKINPLVNIKSFFRTKNSKGETMKVYLTVNDKLSSFKTELSSIPYKTQEELNALLGITFNTNLNDSNKSMLNQDQYLETIINTTNYFGNAFLFSPFESTIRQITGLDTFSLNTSLFGNIIRSSDYWLDLLNDTSLTFGKYLSNEIYLGSTMTFKKKEVNEKIFLPFISENYGLNFKFMLQFELPYVSFGYTFVPNDWRDFLSADHKLSFEANFRF